MVGEVLAVNNDLGGGERKITNIVLMGSGEPLDNYDNVVKFIKMISDENGINISKRNISFRISNKHIALFKAQIKNYFRDSS